MWVGAVERNANVVGAQVRRRGREQAPENHRRRQLERERTDDLPARTSDREADRELAAPLSCNERCEAEQTQGRDARSPGRRRTEGPRETALATQHGREQLG